MTVWQIIVALGLAWAVGRWREPFIVAVMIANFIATMNLAETILNVAIVDSLCIVILILDGKRASKLVAAVYTLMLAVYVVAHFAGVPDYWAFAAVDLLGYAQLMVAGGFSGGLGSLGRRFSGGLARMGRALAFRGQPGIGLARDQAQSGGGLNER